MGHYLLEIQNGEANCNAGFKAPADVIDILSRHGWIPVFIKTDQPVLWALLYLCWRTVKLLFKIEGGSDVFVQYPVYSDKGRLFFRCLRCLLKLKRVRFIGVVHDVRYMRGIEIAVKQEIKEMNLFDVLIVHSLRMKEALMKDGCTKNMRILGLFDYLVENGNREVRKFGFDICYVGNLSNRSFISNLDKLTEGARLEFELYGFPEVESSSAKVHYRGGFKPSDVSSISGCWGLVWDGESLECPQGANAEYQKYNSPHKASLYVVAEMPLIVHSSAAIAGVVREFNIGIVVNSLYELEHRLERITEDEYNLMLECVRQYSERLKSGTQLLTALCN